MKRQYNRESVDGFSRSEAAKARGQATKVRNFDKLVGLKTKNGIEVSEVSHHFGQRAHQRGISKRDVEDALTNPLKVGKIREDGTQQFIGDKSTVAINVDSGKITTTWKTSSKRAKKLKGE